jgi:hypothetical protein
MTFKHYVHRKMIATAKERNRSILYWGLIKSEPNDIKIGKVEGKQADRDGAGRTGAWDSMGNRSERIN